MTNSKLLEAAQKSEVRRVYDKIFDALEGEDSPYVVCALQTYLIFYMSQVSPKDRQHIAHELERRAPEMLEVADRAAAMMGTADGCDCH